MHGLGSASPPMALLSASEELETPEPAISLLVKLVSIFRLLSITTVIGDSRSLAIPCALAPNRLMLAVAISPHGFIAVLMDAATLSRALLIQPGRALRAESQVRSSFRESLQLYMRPHVAHQSSIPSTRTGLDEGDGMARRQRSKVGGLTCIPSLLASRAPTSPPVASPIVCSISRKRFVIRAEGCTSAGR